MSNSVKRCFLKVLSGDTSSNDLTGAALTNKKAEIVNIYKAKGIDESLFTSSFWDSNKWHYTSLQTLLGDASATWYTNKIDFFRQTLENEQFPMIFILDRLDIKSFGEQSSFEGEVQIVINAKSSNNEALLENIAFRIKTILNPELFTNQVIVPNNLSGLNIGLTDITSQSTEYDTLTLTYFVSGQFMEV